MRFIREIGLCFITAAFVFGLYLSVSLYGKANYAQGASDAASFFKANKKAFCRQSLETGTIPPEWASLEGETLAESTYSEYLRPSRTISPP